MILTINLYTLLKFYILGSILGLFTILLHKNLKHSKRNILLSLLLSWLTLTIFYFDIVSLVLGYLRKRIDLYIYYWIENILMFGIFSKNVVLERYFIDRYSRRKIRFGSKIYQKLIINDYYRDKSGEYWDSYAEYFKYRFVRRYGGK